MRGGRKGEAGRRTEQGKDPGMGRGTGVGCEEEEGDSGVGEESIYEKIKG